MESLKFFCVLALTLATFTGASAQDAPAPEKAPKPAKIRSRAKLLQDLQTDLDAAIPHAKTDAKSRKILDKCHDTIVDASEQQRRYKSVNQAKVNHCLDNLEKLEDAGVFPDADRDKLRKDGEALAATVGKPRVRLPKPF